MGRGRSGITWNQSMRKPKFVKKEKGEAILKYIAHSPPTKNDPPIAIDHIVAQMKKMSPQDVMNLLIPNQSN